ncbi:MAG: NADPH-dependent FMN reductase [Bacteroidetes bacterium]|nr:MAG: NADPH-dependent FMN reductase [Bacteroidota bacterium]
MITVICATNRPENVTRKAAELYKQLLDKKKVENLLFSLEELPIDFAFNNDVYGNSSVDFHRVVEKYIVSAEKFVVIAPEYNGSIPGVFKTFIDGIKPEVLMGKKMAMVGVSAGRAGNLRGMDHLTNIVNYLDMEVYPFKVPISSVNSLMNGNGELTDVAMIETLQKQVDGFVKF